MNINQLSPQHRLDHGNRVRCLLLLALRCGLSMKESAELLCIGIKAAEYHKAVLMRGFRTLCFDDMLRWTPRQKMKSVWRKTRWQLGK